MSYSNELNNLETFGRLYGPGGTAARALRRRSRESRRRSGGGGGSAAGGGEVELLVPNGLPRWSSGRCLAMSWVDGEPLLARRCATLPQSELPIVRFGIEATLSQMLDKGYMHADPHGGNLVRLARPPPLVSALCHSLLSLLSAL